MEQSSIPSLSKPITDDEREVSEILINLPKLIRKSEAFFNLPIWGVKGRRSAINLTPSPPYHRRPEKKPKIAAGESSPATPQSYDKTQQSRKIVPHKKTIEELLKTMNELVQAKESLTRELERVMGYYNNLEIYNKVLKAKQQQLRFEQSEPNKEPDKKSLNPGSELNQNKTPFSFLLENHQQAQPKFLTLLQQQQSNFANSFNNLQYPCNRTLPLSPPPPSAPAKVSHVASPGLPDLNISTDVEQPQPSDRNIQALGDCYRARAAEARKRRTVIVKKRKFNLTPPKC